MSLSPKHGSARRIVAVGCVFAIGAVLVWRLTGAGSPNEAPRISIGRSALAQTPEVAESDASAGSSKPELSEEAGQDWPVFLGPLGTNVSTETGLLVDWPAEGPPVAWSRRVGEAYSAPVIARGRLVMFYRAGDEEVVECVNARTGEPVWRFEYPTRYEDRYGYNNGPRSSPAIDGDRVYTFGAEGVLTCIEFGTGKRVWQRPINAEYRVPQNFFGVGQAPVVEGDLILINVGSVERAGVAGFDKLTGETVWEAGDDGAGYSTPIVRTIHDERLAIFFTMDGLIAVNAETGEERYDYAFRSRTRESVNAATPVVVDDRVFLSATYNTGSVLLKMGQGGELTEIWKDRRAMQNHWATSIYHEGNLYGMDGRHESGSNFRCIDFMTGEVKWTADEGLGRASYIMADGHLIALGERGELALIEVSPEQYIEKARVAMLRYPCWTPPVLSHGLLYIRNENTLGCLDLRDPERWGKAE